MKGIRCSEIFLEGDKPSGGGDGCVRVRALYEGAFSLISLAKYLKLLYILCVCAHVC